MRLERNVREDGDRIVFKLTNPMTGSSICRVLGRVDVEALATATGGAGIELVWAGLRNSLLTAPERALFLALRQCQNEEFGRIVYRGGPMDGKKGRIGIGEDGYPLDMINTVSIGSNGSRYVGDTIGVIIYRRVDSPSLGKNGHWVWPYRPASHHASVDGGE